MRAAGIDGSVPIPPAEPRGWLPGLVPASLPQDRRKAIPLPVRMGPATYDFSWSRQCRVCAALTPFPPGEGVEPAPKYPEGPAVYHRVNSLYMAMVPLRQIERDIAGLTSHWAPEDRPGRMSIARHTATHFAPDIQARLAVGRGALKEVGVDARAGAAQEYRALAELLVGLEKDLVKGAGADEYFLTLWRFGRAVADNTTQEQRDRIGVRLRELMGREPAADPFTIRDPAGELPPGEDEEWDFDDEE